ncbi:variant erythrocyte surface antigen-1 family protein [Babesia divergens]|uniref:Variant erythrocyte surface antigen-1 family protein n=1 Tax=Babesia divergens TaxID=32595 RepID=A0AAD9GG88_BABDI|nr:variant erythrocyte surface antigen-1 family protein [Babesia divergens]
MVCCMYYTDVFVGTNNIDNLKSALKAELKGFNDSNALTQLVQGLCLFMGYPSCVCKPKKSVKESLKKISKELKEELKNYKCLNSKPLNLNCDSCISSVVCKCCVLDCILKVQNSTCQCVKGGTNKNCDCSIGEPKRCCKDLLEKLKASLSLLNLKTDMESLCKCNDEKCCDKGVCTGGSSKCQHCDKLKTPNDYTVTGLGLLRPSPKRLAERLEGFFGSGPGPKSGCSCTCGSGSTSCCCLACPGGKCSESCTAKCGSKCSHGSSQCPCKTFCLAINGIKIAAESTERTCCEGGQKCHCELDKKCSGSTSSSGQGCCIETDNSGRTTNYKHSLKCMIRRLVSYFKSLETSSTPDIKNFKNCCEFLCVLKTCEFLRKFYGKRNATGCSKCRKNQGKKCGGKCCNGTISKCTDPDCCKDCPDCGAVKFSKALETLRFAGPCGQDLYRVLKDFLECCGRLHGSLQYVEEKLRKPIQTCNCQTLKPGQPCSCCSSVSGTSQSSGNCKGCKDLLGDSKLKALLFSQYSSSYSSASASWPDCKSKSGSCCSPPCGSCTSGSCPSEGCCEKCPKRLCAKIFLGMLPCLYYALQYLYDRCKGDWKDLLISNKDHSLGRFLVGMGFDLAKLQGKKGGQISSSLSSLFTSSNGSEFKDLYEKSKNYFTSFSHSLSSGSLSPSTVRQMLLWLYGLRFHKHFSGLVENCKSLCSPFGNSFHPDAFCYYIYTCSFILPVAIISSIEDSDSALSLISSSSDWQKFSYPEDLSSLFEKLCEYARKIFVALNFLCIQCKNGPSQAGWQSCYFGGSCKKALGNSLASTSVSSSSSGSGCSCPNSKTYLCTGKASGTDAHDHCKDGQSCLGFSGSCTQGSGHSSANCKPCPHPLMRFLVDGSSDSSFPTSDSNSESYPFGLPGITPMGFSKENLSSTARDGYDLYAVLKVFCESGFYPLTRLVQFILCVSRYPPETLGEFFAFFMKFKDSDVFKNNFESYVSEEPGFYSGEDLKSALEKLFGSHSGSHSDLKSLSYCEGPKGSNGPHPTCGRYLYPLTYNVYKEFIEGFLGTYLSWICHLGPKFYSKFKDFNTEASTKFSCCSSSCDKIVHCPCALPFLYSYGFQFNSPNTLNSGKKCSDFISQLGKVVGKGSPLQALLDAIDAFLWSIRKPFFLFILAFWAFVISYFLYVQLYKLDLLHIDSHLHLPRSFKILPSTLFSDASSKLKDLSYFTL